MPTVACALALTLQTLLAGAALPPEQGADPRPATSPLDELAARLERERYRFSAGGAGRFAAENRAQGVRAAIEPDGLVLEPCAEEADASWSLRLATRAVGRAGHLVPAGAAHWTQGGGRIELRRAGSTEWLVNDPRGLEQGWTIPVPPPGPEEAPLLIELAFEGLGATALPGNRALLLHDEAGEPRLRYHGLRAWDASGRELEAAIRPSDGGATIEVELAGALYPVEVDPLLSAPNWSAGGEQAGAAFGFAVTGAGDVNGDGYDDALVGAPGYDGGQLDEGVAFLFLGSATGLAFEPAWSFESDQAGAELGASVASAGDLNGDGYGDVVIGAPRYDAGELDEGRAFVFLGSPAGLAAAPDWTAEVDQIGALFGNAVAGAGDVDGDGFDDLIVGAREHEHQHSSEGSVFVFLGSPNGPATSWSWRASGGQAGARFGWSVAGAGDVDADGFDDLLVGAIDYDAGHTSEGAAFLYPGSPTGPMSAPTWWVEGGQTAALLGIAVAGAGDVNGDGFDDVLVGARWYDGGHANEGGAFLHFGSASGPSPTPDWTAVGGEAFAGFGQSLDGAGDVNGDGFDDVVVGALFLDDGQQDEGGVLLYRGSPAGPSPLADWKAHGQQPFARYGRSVAAAGDVDGDGFADLIAGGDGLDLGEVDEGGSILYLGQRAHISIFCACDGAGTPPPCANPGASYRGCAGASGEGCLLWATGQASVSRDSLVLRASGAAPDALAVFLQGERPANRDEGPAFGDGLRCAGGTLIRLQIGFTDGTGALNTTVPVAEHGRLEPGDTRRYQVWYQDPGSPCGSGFNTSNGVEIRWIP